MLGTCEQLFYHLRGLGFKGILSLPGYLSPGFNLASIRLTLPGVIEVDSGNGQSSSPVPTLGIF